MNYDNINGMRRALDVYAMRNQTINNNLANVDTPKYKREYVKFEEYLDENKKLYLSGTKTHDRHIDIPEKSLAQGVITRDNSHSTRLDGNNVNADVEAAEQVKNSIMYNAVAERLNRTLQTMRTAINEGGK